MELKMNINFGEFIYQTLKLLPEKYLFAHARTNMEVKSLSLFFFFVGTGYFRRQNIKEI